MRKCYLKKIAVAFLTIISILYIFNIILFPSNRIIQITIGMLMLFSIIIIIRKNKEIGRQSYLFSPLGRLRLSKPTVLKWWNTDE